MTESREMRVALRRMADLARADPEVAAARSTARDLAFIREGREHAVELVAAACERYASRPALAERDPGGPFRPIRYDELWQRVIDLARGLRARFGVLPGRRVAICGDATVDWVVADLACLYLGAVSVPLKTGVGDEEGAHILAQAESVAVLVGAAQVDEVAPAAGRCESVRGLVVMGGAAPAQGSGSTESDGCRLDRTSLAAVEAAGREAADLAHHRPDPDDPFSVVYTSGSTGLPKGVVLQHQRWATTLRNTLAARPLPHITVGYLPLSHMAGRITVYTTLMMGGLVNLVARGDMSTLFEDIRLARPTHLTLVPRVSGLVHQHFQTEVARRAGADADADRLSAVREQVMAEMRGTFLGDRICFATTGAAPTPPDVVAFLERCFGIYVVDNYGSTEIGQVAVNGRVMPWVQYKLVDRPELGYTTGDRPYPRGELAVKSPNESPGYLHNAEASAALRDADGYVLSGDIVEERAPGHIVWIDRKSSVLRLASGEFVNVERIEQLLTADSPDIEQAFVYGNPLRAYVLAVLVPSELAASRCAGEPDPDAALARLLRAEIDRTAATAGLPAHEIPRDFIVERVPFSAARALLTETDKLRRPNLRARYHADLDRLYAQIEARQVASLGSAARSGSPGERVSAAVALTLGLPGADAVVPSRTFAELGGDSLSAVRLKSLIDEACEVSIPVAAILDPTLPVAGIVARVEEALASSATDELARVHDHPDGWARAKDLNAERLLAGVDLSLERSVRGQPPIRPRRVLLTGANGFLGRFIALDLLRRLPEARVTCLVRAPTRERAMERMRAAFATAAAAAELAAGISAGRIEVVPGDFTRPDLGLGEDAYAELAAAVDAVVHNGALVNHVLGYRDLFAPNVRGTANMVRFALSGPRKRFHFVSTVGVAAGIRRRSPILESEAAASLWPRRPIHSDGTAYALGYATSKWAAEVLLGDVHDRTELPVTVSRCSMVLPHRLYPGEMNRSDAFVRLLASIVRTGVAPRSFFADGYDRPRGYDGVPVDDVAAVLGRLVAAGEPGFRTVHVSCAGAPSLDAIVAWAREAGCAIDALPYDDWVREIEARLGALPALERGASVLPILDRWREPQRRAPAPLSTTECEALVADAGGIGPIDRDYVAGIVAALGGAGAALGGGGEPS